MPTALPMASRFEARGGELMQLSRPLGLRGYHGSRGRLRLGTLCGSPDLSLSERVTCGIMRPQALRQRRSYRTVRPEWRSSQIQRSPPGVSQPPPKSSAAGRQSDLRWAKAAGNAACVSAALIGRAYIGLADSHYEPGVVYHLRRLRVLAVLEGAGKHHRNVIFNGRRSPEPMRSLLRTSDNAVGLWRGLEETCTGRL